jgi:hypothetical protein
MRSRIRERDDGFESAAAAVRRAKLFLFLNLQGRVSDPPLRQHLDRAWASNLPSPLRHRDRHRRRKALTLDLLSLQRFHPEKEPS